MFTRAAIANPLFLLAGSQSAPVSSHEIEDDFTSDTSADYTVLTGALLISDGTAKRGTDALMRAWHQTELSSADMYVQANVENRTASSSGVLLRRSASNARYYVVGVENSKIRLTHNSGALADSGTGTLYTNASYHLRAEVVTNGTSNEISVYLDGAMTATWTYTHTNATDWSGKFVGISSGYNVGNAVPTVDNFEAGAL